MQAAKRELSEECGSSVKVKFYSHTPSAVLSYKHPPLPHDEHSSLGSKVSLGRGREISIFYIDACMILASLYTNDHCVQ